MRTLVRLACASSNSRLASFASSKLQVGWEDLVVHALHEGDAIAAHESVMTIEGDYTLFAHLETVYLGCLARRTLIMRNVASRVAGGARC